MVNDGGLDFCSDTQSLSALLGSVGGRGGIKMVSASTPSANEPARTSF